MSTPAVPTRIITRTLDVQNAVEPLNSFQICRGDTVQFNLTFMRGAEELDYTNYTLRVFAKAVNRDGIVSPEADPLFSLEQNFSTTFFVGSTQTAGAAGPYLLTVIVLDTSLTIPQTITTQCIYFDLLENGYAGVYQPGQDFRDEVFAARDEAVAAKDLALQYASEAGTEATNAATSAQDASDSATAALASKQDAVIASQSAAADALDAAAAKTAAETAQGKSEDAQTAAEAAQTAAEAAETNAEAARDQAVAAKDAALSDIAAALADAKDEIDTWSDQSARFAADEAKIEALELGKINSGALHFAGGSAATSSIATIAPFSVCATIAAGFAGSFAFGNITFTAASNELTVSDGTSTLTAALSVSAASAVVFIQTASASKLYVGGNLAASGSLSFTAGTFTATGTGALSRLKAFNIDLSAEGALYTVAEYTAGADEPPALHGAPTQTNTDPDLGANTSGGWSGTRGTRGVWTAGVYVNYINNADLTGDSEAASLGITSAVDFITSYYGMETGVTSGLYNNTLNLKDFAGKAVIIRYSFYAKRLQNVAGRLGIFIPPVGAGVNVGIKTFTKTDTPYNEWVNLEGIINLAMPLYTAAARVGLLSERSASLDYTTGFFRLANFEFSVVSSTALSLADYTVKSGTTQTILDASGNANDATITGSVAGTNDTAIARLIDFVKA